MGIGGTDARAGGRWTLAARSAEGRAEISLEQAAWLLAVPCALVTIAAMLLLGQPLGEVLFPGGSDTYLADVGPLPEPTEQARFVISLAAPVLLSVLLGAFSRRPPSANPALVKVAVACVQWLGLAFVVACFVVQWNTIWVYLPPENPGTVYFTMPTLVVALLIAVAIAVAMERPDARAWYAAVTRETPLRRVAAAFIAVCAVALWYSTAIHREVTVGNLNPSVSYHIPFSLDEAFAVLDGRTPLVDFIPQYGPLWSYVVAVPMAVFGASVETWSIALAVFAMLAMFALFDVLRRLTGSAVSGLLLFLPVLATSGFMMQGPLENRYGLSNLPSMVPMRYAGPLLLLWLTTRHLQGARASRRWPILFVGGLLLFANFEFGVAGFAATVIALAIGARITWAGVARLALEAVTAVLAAYAAFALLSFVRAGELPDPFLLTRFSRIFQGGFGMLPMEPIVGIALLIYLTYVAAIATAVVRRLQGARDPALTALLAWSGCFGLGIGMYYVGRSHPEVLINMFPAWALCVALLLLVVVRAAAGGGVIRRFPAGFAVLFAFGLMVCSLAQTPTPWGQVDRLRDTAQTAALRPPAGQDFVAARTRPGEPVAILMHLGHRMAYDLDLDNVIPYAGSESLMTREQVQEVMAALRDAGGRHVFAQPEFTRDSILDEFLLAGFTLGIPDAQGRFVQLIAPWDPSEAG